MCKLSCFWFNLRWVTCWAQELADETACARVLEKEMT